MPDINIDTLFIIGLVVASLIGKIFKKKEATDSPEKKVDSESSLEDMLKDAWQKVTHPKKEKTETPPPIVSNVSSEKKIEIERSPKLVAPPITKRAINLPSKGSNLSTIWDYPDKKIETQKTTTLKKLLSSKASLKQAFVIKEVLDQPLSIRRESK